jgi:DNA-binding transcriptional regulator YiaG
VSEVRLAEYAEMIKMNFVQSVAILIDMSKDSNLPTPYYRISKNLIKYRKKTSHNRKEVAFLLGGTRKKSTGPIQNNLRKYRERAGLSIEQVAQRVGVTPGTIRKWEQGRLMKSGLHGVRLYELYNATHLQLYPEYVKTINREIDERVRIWKRLKRKGIL